MVLVVNLSRFSQQGERFAVYRSAPGDFSRWEMVGHYAGHVRAAAVRDGAVWTFFEDGLYRAYAVVGDGDLLRSGAAGDAQGKAPEGGRVEEPDAVSADLPGREARGEAADAEAWAAGRTPPFACTGAGRLPFDWTPRFACTGLRDGLWVVGIAEGEIVTARLAAVGTTASSARPGKDGFSSWRTGFPAKALRELREVPAGGGAGKGQPSVAGEEPPEAGIAVRAYAARELYVFWHVRHAGGSRAEGIHGARLHHSHRDPTLPGAWWEDLPVLDPPGDCVVDDFCVAPSHGEVGVVARCRVPRLSGWLRKRMFHARLVSRDGRVAWTELSAIPGTAEGFRFAQLAGTSWVRWGPGGLLLTSNTQRVRVIEYSPEGGVGESSTDSGAQRGLSASAQAGGEWKLYSPAPWFVTYLPDIQLMAILASALLLVVTGTGVFLARLYRLWKSAAFGRQEAVSVPAAPYAGVPRPGVEAGHRGLRPAPLLVRVFAALIDLMIVGGVVILLPGMRDPPPSPVLPGLAPLVRQLMVLAALTAYGTAMEATSGATLGKMVTGLRVVRLSLDRQSTEPLGPGRALVRNLFRFIDTGAVGLAVILVTDAIPGSGARRRFGDMAAGSAVVVAEGRPPAKDEG